MKNILLILLFIASSLYIKAQSLSGTVTDSISHETLPGAVVFIPQLKLGSTAGAKGNYKITNLPNGTYQVEVLLVGYATVSQQVTIKEDATFNFKMIMSCCLTGECVVTAVGNVTDIQRTPMPITIVSHETLVEETSSSIIDAISTQPGVSMTTEGVNTTKPQINGLGFDRVLVLTDGLREEDFQWGDDHGILIDPYAVHDAEIIRGPASLQYGASAEAGVISFKTEPFAENGTTQGSVLTEYQTNNGYIGTSMGIGGNHNGFMWTLRASQEQTHDYWDPKDGYVWGTDLEQENVRLILGVTKKWGYSRLSFSTLHRRIQVPDGNRDSTGRFEFDFPQNGQIYPTSYNFFAYDPTIASAKILDETQIWWQNSLNVGRGTIGLDVGFTESVHHDIDTGTIGEGNFHVQDIPYNLKYQVAGQNSGLKFTAGVNGTYEWEANYAPPPFPYTDATDYEIPNYTDLQAGGYAILQKDYKNLTLSGGLRYDYNNFIGQGLYLLNYGTEQLQVVSAGTPGETPQFTPFNNTYSGPSGSIGATWQLPDNNYIKLNVSESWRAPSIDQITSNGENIGVNAIQIGNINLKAEQGTQVDVAWGNNGQDVSFEADGFYNQINNFIFATRTGLTDSASGLPIFDYTANTAIIYGAAGYFNIHPSDSKWIELDNGFTYTYSYFPNQTDSTDHIPFTPAPRLTSEVKLKLNDKPNSILKGTYIKFGLQHDWEQDNIYSAYLSELPSMAYTIYNAGIGTNFVNPKTKKVICAFYVNCTNLTNLAYADHLNLAQYFHAINGTPVPVTDPSQGIYNMGRNIGFKLIFPFGGNSASVPSNNTSD